MRVKLSIKNNFKYEILSTVIFIDDEIISPELIVNTITELGRDFIKSLYDYCIEYLDSLTINSSYLFIEISKDNQENKSAQELSKILERKIKFSNINSFKEIKNLERG